MLIWLAIPLLCLLLLTVPSRPRPRRTWIEAADVAAALGTLRDASPAP